MSIASKQPYYKLVTVLFTCEETGGRHTYTFEHDLNEDFRTALERRYGIISLTEKRGKHIYKMKTYRIWDLT